MIKEDSPPALPLGRELWGCEGGRIAAKDGCDGDAEKRGVRREWPRKRV